MNIPGPPRLPSFDKRFNDLQKKRTSLFGLAFGIWCVWACICLGLLGTVIYVAVHFLAKVW